MLEKLGMLHVKGRTYQTIIGYLIYPMVGTIPDIASALTSQNHLIRAQRLLKYIQVETITIWSYFEEKLSPYGNCDASWGC